MPWDMDRLTPGELHMLEANEEADMDVGETPPAPRPKVDPFSRVPDVLRAL